MSRHFEIIRDFGEEDGKAEQHDLIEILGKIRAGDRVAILDSGMREPAWLALRAGQISTKKQTFGLWVDGWSAVEALINNGDIVILQQNCEVREGDLVAVYLENDESALLKKIYWNGEHIELKSANVTIPPLLVRATEVHMQGKVVAIVPHECLKNRGRSGRLIMM